MFRFSSIAFFLCSFHSFSQLSLEGIWSCTLDFSAGKIPFELKFSKIPSKFAWKVFILNGKEELPMDETYFEGDSLVIPMRLFDSEFKLIPTAQKLTGVWRKKTSKGFVQLNFEAFKGYKQRFMPKQLTKKVITGRWEMKLFMPNVKDSTKAVGIFQQSGTKLEGSILTPSGDYRYLTGSIDKDSIFLSTFDGTHVFLLKGYTTGTRTYGNYWFAPSPIKHYFSAERNPKAELIDLSKVISVQDSSQKITFTVHESTGKTFNINDPKYQGKALIIQVLGSWCPNCMDESIFLGNWSKSKPSSVEIIGFAFERSEDSTVVLPKLTAMKKRLGMDYAVLWSGKPDKESTMKIFPMFAEGIKYYPTTLFLDKNHRIFKTHSGFSGPATGIEYEKFIKEFNQTIQLLISQ